MVSKERDLAGLRLEERALLRFEVEELLYEEATMLDEWRLDDWLTLFTEDARYTMPTTDLPNGNPATDVVFIDDDMSRIRGRVKRLKSRHAHREFPWSVNRRLVTNVRVISADDKELVATASLLVYRSRMGQMDPYVGHATYTLKRIDGALKIHRRRVVLDMERLSQHGAVSIIV
ncbi:MAG: phenylpropionate dioxygenase [Dehalococcoidia bacterium]|nr:phenylpropionate dioxygenase [Dehalococcoidia bacterium]